MGGIPSSAKKGSKTMSIGHFLPWQGSPCGAEDEGLNTGDLGSDPELPQRLLEWSWTTGEDKTGSTYLPDGESH